MPVKIRLTRMGKKKQPTYRVVVVDSRKPRDGAHIEQIGRYDPRQEPSVVEIDNDRALKWLQDGAQPTERARKLLEISGAWARFRVARGEIHTIDEAPPPAPPVPAAAAEPEPVVVDDSVAEEPAAEEGATESDTAVGAEMAAAEPMAADEDAEADAGADEADAGVEESEAGADDAPVEEEQS
jgi:small subunit ribosomal protein S16